MLFLFSLPHVIQEKIQSYLYFSGPVAKKIDTINHIVLNYTQYLMEEIIDIFKHRTHTLYFRVFRFVLSQDDLKNILKHHTNFVLDELDERNVFYHVANIMNEMNISKRQKMYNYIMFGPDSGSSLYASYA